MMISCDAADAAAQGSRSFLMLNDQSVEFVEGAPVLGYWPTTRRWDAKEKRSIEIVDGVEFVSDKQFWKTVKENDARNSVKSEIRIEENGRLYYRGKPVELGLGVGRIEYALRWRDWIVAVGTAADPSRSTIKGPIWYLFWFGEKSLRGSHRQISTVVALPLRIYSK
jgi:hypothetical protein